MRKLPSMLIMVALLVGMMLLAACGGAATESELVAEATEPAVSEPAEEIVEPTEEMVEPTEEIVEPTEEMVEPTEEIDTPEPEEMDTPEPEEMVTPEPEEEMEAAMNTVQVELVSFEINMPDTLPAGPATFEVSNTADFEHNMVIEGQGISQTLENDLQPGESGTIVVDLPAGTYEVYCPIGNHRAMGMELTLTVTDGDESAMDETQETAEGEEAMPETDQMALSAGLELVADGLTAPLALSPVPDESGRLFVADQTGQVWIINADGELLDEPFLDISERLVTLDERYDERGLLGIAFHPQYAENGRFFVYYSAPLRAEAPADWNHTSHVSAFTVSAENPDMADAASEQVLLQVDQPQGNHDGGAIAFGPDGYLYVPLGDGGGADDVGEGHVADWYDVNEGGNGQDVAQNLLGSILRIDVDGEGTDGRAYAIPEDNPFADQAGAEEVWAIGFRNPYRMSFDMGGEQALFVGDAGQNLYEEVSIVEAGGNYGWNVKEGTHCFSTADPGVSLDECPAEDADGRALVDPIIEYGHPDQPDGVGIVVIGGNVYRGSALPDWQGWYIFGDWSTSFQEPDGTLLIAAPPETEGAMWTMQELAVTGREDNRLNEFLRSFGQDNEGEVYALTSDVSGPSGDSGKVYRIVAP